MSIVSKMLNTINNVVQGNKPVQITHYRGYIIRYAPPPIPIRTSDWQFEHDDYDPTPYEIGGPPGDHRAGYGASIEDCMAQIDELEDDEDLIADPNADTRFGFERQDDIAEKVEADIDDDGYGPDDEVDPEVDDLAWGKD